MLTARELDNPSLNPGMPTSVQMLARYWALVLNRPITVEEVQDALQRLHERWCREEPVECAEGKRQLAELTRSVDPIAWRTK